MEMEFEDKKTCRDIKVDGFIEKGKQFDLEITLPEDNRNVIYGVIKDCYKEPVEDAVVQSGADDRQRHRGKQHIENIVLHQAERIGPPQRVDHSQRETDCDDDSIPIDILTEERKRHWVRID